jgi:hypothetical protein
MNRVMSSLHHFESHPEGFQRRLSNGAVQWIFPMQTFKPQKVDNIAAFTPAQHQINKARMKQGYKPQSRPA